MKVASLFARAFWTLVSTWGLSGCSTQEPGTTTENDIHDKAAEIRNKHAETAGHKLEEHAKRDDHDGHRGDQHQEKQIAPQDSVKVGDITPDFSVQTLDGKTIKLSELQRDASRTKKGVIVLSFWCSTCHSCRHVEHLLAKLRKDYEGRAAVLALDANADETAERVAAFVKKNGLELPVVLDSVAKTADLFGVTKTTTTVVIDGNGVLRYCGQFRQKDGGSAEEALKAVLAGQEVAIKTTPPQGLTTREKVAPVWGGDALIHRIG